ncbi:MAG: hypothetical protein WED05_09475 [Candidatus Atabeyarchaeum deiterrae]
MDEVANVAGSLVRGRKQDLSNHIARCQSSNISGTEKLIKRVRDSEEGKERG